MEVSSAYKGAIDDRASLAFRRVVFAICPTGAYCREDRCQSFFKFDLIPTMRAPLEECESAGAISAAGASAWIIDGPAARLDDNTFIKQLADHAPELVVIVVTFGTLADDLLWAQKIKDVLPTVTIGVRGAPCYVMDSEILHRAPAVDFCVRGEYEIVFDDIVRKGFESARGTSFRVGAEIRRAELTPRIDDLDSLPRPDRSSINQKLYAVRGLRRPQATVRVQRGCPYPCTYCLVHTVSGSRARHRSPASIAQEMCEVKQTGVTSFYLRADTFSLNRAWALETCAAIAKECPGVRWVTTTRAERVDDELLRAMAESGCYGISFGLDVASPTIGAHVEKLADLEMARAALRLCDKYGILSLAYLMIGFLWETRETLNETATFIRSIRPDLLTIHFAHPYPGTKYYDTFMAQNMKVTSLRAQAEPAGGTSGVSLKELELAARTMIRQHYVRPAVLASLARKALKIVFS